MAKLEFYGPFHFDHVDPKTGQFKSEDKKRIYPGQSIPNPNQPGIYIWGFMYEYDKSKKQGIEPLNFNNKEITTHWNIPNYSQFIPYYVGMRGPGKNNKDNIYKRIKEHHNIRNHNALKYARYSPDYMKKFFKDDDFPVYIRNNEVEYFQKICNLIHKNLNLLNYVNNEVALNEIYKNIGIKTNGTKKPYHYPIDRQLIGVPPVNNIQDSLDDLINSNTSLKKNNFFFCYATVDKVSIPIIENLETYTFWSLKGYTTSKTGVCPDPKSHKIIDHTKTNIFDTVNSASANIFDTVNGASKKFDGY